MSHLLSQTTEYIRDTLVQLVTDPPQQRYDPSSLSSLSARELLKNLLRSLVAPWTKQTDPEHSNGKLTKWSAGILCGTVGLSALVILRERLLKRREKDIRTNAVLITGGASGIGRILAEKMALREGCRVIVWDINEELVDATVQEIEKKGGFVRGYRVDVSDRKQVHLTADRVREEVGHVDILINNAGIVHGKSVLESDEEMMEKVMKVNAISNFYTTKAFLPNMAERNEGHIVSVCSASAFAAVPRMSDYSASKSAALSFMESLRMELKNSTPGVRTTIVCPYYINTGMFDGVTTKFPRLLPILKPGWVTDKIIQGIKRNEELMILPRFVYSVFFFRLACPTWLQDVVADSTGITHSMDNFQGKKPEERMVNQARLSQQ